MLSLLRLRSPVLARNFSSTALRTKSVSDTVQEVVEEVRPLCPAHRAESIETVPTSPGANSAKQS